MGRASDSLTRRKVNFPLRNLALAAAFQQTSVQALILKTLLLRTVNCYFLLKVKKGHIMESNFSAEEIMLLLTSLDYSKQRIRDAQGTPQNIRNDELNAIEKISEKLRAFKKNL